MAKIVNKRIKDNLTGFTLVELIVSIAILATISGLFLANYSSLRKRAGLPAAANKLASDIRMAQSYALGAKKINNQIPVGGWGVYFIRNLSAYRIFADNGSGPGKFAEEHDGQDDDYRVLCFAGDAGNCNDNITVSTLTGFKPGSGSVVFLPPDPIVYFDGDQAAKGTDPSARITLTDSTTGETKDVTINFFGLVEVE